MRILQAEIDEHFPAARRAAGAGCAGAGGVGVDSDDLDFMHPSAEMIADAQARGLDITDARSERVQGAHWQLARLLSYVSYDLVGIP